MEKWKAFCMFKSEKAQSVVEFALMFPVLMLLLAIVVDVSHLVDTKILLQGVTCEAATRIKRIDNDDDINAWVSAAKSDYGDRLDLSRLKIKTTKTKPIKQDYTYHTQSVYGFTGLPSHYTYAYVTVTATYDAKLIMPLNSIIFGDTLKLNSEFTAQVYLNGYQMPAT